MCATVSVARRGKRSPIARCNSQCFSVGLSTNRDYMYKCFHPGADSRSVMPLDALGCTRTTLAFSTCCKLLVRCVPSSALAVARMVYHRSHSPGRWRSQRRFSAVLGNPTLQEGQPDSETGIGNPMNLRRDWARWLQLFTFKEECLVRTSHQLVRILSLPFVHTARRCYR